VESNCASHLARRSDNDVIARAKLEPTRQAVAPSAAPSLVGRTVVRRDMCR